MLRSRLLYKFELRDTLRDRLRWWPIAQALADWVQAMVLYFRVMKVLAPQRHRIMQMEEKISCRAQELELQIQQCREGEAILTKSAAKTT